MHELVIKTCPSKKAKTDNKVLQTIYRGIHCLQHIKMFAMGTSMYRILNLLFNATVMQHHLMCGTPAG